MKVDSDALALLIVRLDSDRPGDGDLCWHPWDEAVGAQPHGLSEIAPLNPAGCRPFKRFPGDDDWPYFNSHVNQLLFPPGNRRGGRWLCCPDDLFLDLHRRAGSSRRARVDLLERVSTPLQPGCTFGLIHLSLERTEEAGAPDTLWWGTAIRTHLRRRSEPSRIVLGGRDLDPGRPVRAFATELFGDPHRHLEQSLYTVLMAEYLPAETEPVDERTWRRALAKRRGSAKAKAWSQQYQAKEDRQTVHYAGATGLVLGNCTAFTVDGEIDGTYARNLRSYWAESLVFGLLQQKCLEDFQSRLAEIGDPLKPEIEDLHHNWLSFRNSVWWSQLSTSTEVPQELISRLREELGTERLFGDLEGDLATYSAQQHRRAQDAQSEALANLQVYGSGLVVLTTLAAIIGLFSASGGARALLVAIAVIASVAVSLFVRAQL
ncbi:MAG TPA: hypothetical protein VG458_04950, partial [Solirubrobacterales bacterium]|nr:hypothetical protein [Solirubrobacterales bacterium]